VASSPSSTSKIAAFCIPVSGLAEAVAITFSFLR
jgi:hypothetical protein